MCCLREFVFVIGCSIVWPVGWVSGWVDCLASHESWKWLLETHTGSVVGVLRQCAGKHVSHGCTGETEVNCSGDQAQDRKV